MRRGIMIVAVALIVFAGIGITIGAYNAGERSGLDQQIQTIETTTPDGTPVVQVVVPDGPYGMYGDRWGHHGGFFPGGLFIVFLLVFGTALLVRALVWRGHGPGGHGPGWGPPGGREEWRSRAESWHRQMHEGDAGAGTGTGAGVEEPPPAPA